MVYTYTPDEHKKAVNKYRRVIKKNMEGLSIYKPQFSLMIDKLADLLYIYDKLNEKLGEADYDVIAETAAGGIKGSPAFKAMDAVLKQIAAYSDRLCLNPKALMSADRTEEKPGSKLDEALRQLGA